MSRYIRTKDGRIVDTTKYPEHPASWGVQASDYALTIAQSENLEELCDEFVVWLDENNCHFTTTNYLYIYQNRDKAKATFGAIWTSKGLIYVAKMNENGKLELI